MTHNVVSINEWMDEWKLFENYITTTSYTLFYVFYVYTTILSTMQHIRGLQVLYCSINLTFPGGKTFTAQRLRTKLGRPARSFRHTATRSRENSSMAFFIDRRRRAHSRWSWVTSPGDAVSPALAHSAVMVMMTTTLLRGGGTDRQRYAACGNV